MDKWDEMTHSIQQGFLAEEPEAVMAAVFKLAAEFGRTLEQIGADLDRIATATETTVGKVFDLSTEIQTTSVEPKALDL